MTHDFGIHISLNECIVRFSFGSNLLAIILGYVVSIFVLVQKLLVLLLFLNRTFSVNVYQMHTYHTTVVEKEKNECTEFYNCIPQTLNIASVINVFDLVSKHVKNDRR